MIRRREQASTVPPAWRRYLEHGDYRSGPADPADLEVFTLAGAVLRGRLDGLRAAWAQHGPIITAEWSAAEGPPFAVDVLEDAAEGDVFGVLAILRRRGPCAPDTDTEQHEEE